MTAKIIKGGDKKSGGAPAKTVEAPVEEGAVIHKRVLDARAQAEEIIAEARAKAQAIRKEAEAVLKDAKIKREEAIRGGFASGESRGLASVTEKLVQLKTLREKFYENAESEIIKLVLEIAEKVIGKVAQENKNLIRSVVHQALEKALGDRITVRLNPVDYKSIMESDHEFKDVIDRTKRLLFREDDAITPGGCIVETEVGTIDAKIETQLAAIKKALTL